MPFHWWQTAHETPSLRRASSLSDESAVSGRVVPLVSAAPIGPWQFTQMRLGSGYERLPEDLLSTWLLCATMTGLVMACACIERRHSLTVAA